MVALEVIPNSNCEAVDLRVFEELSPPRVATHVRVEQPEGRLDWYEVVGWTADGTACPARVQKVSDSGDGIAWLVHGGEAGLRLRPEDSRASWSADEPTQWGQPFVLLGDEADVRVAC